MPTIGWWGAMNLTNDYCGNDGGSNIRIPLMRELNARGHNIWTAVTDPGNYEYDDSALKALGIAAEARRYKDSVEFTRGCAPHELAQCDVVILECRPAFNEIECAEMNDIIELCAEEEVQVILWDQDNWAADSVEDDLMRHVHHIRPWPLIPTEWTKTTYFPYFWSDTPECNVEPQYDFVYVGNRYGREAQMDAFLDSIEGHSVLLVGNWKRKCPEIAAKQHVTAVGSTPHYSTIPLLSLGRITFHVGKPDYNEMGMISMRPYEAHMANRACLISDSVEYVDSVFHNQYINANFEDPTKALGFAIMDEEKACEAQRLFVKDADILNRDVSTAADQLEGLFEC